MALRLGELLVGGGLLTTEQLEQALRAQVMWGGRLGTNLIELGCVDLDSIARALGAQHRMPAALGKHFDKVDRELQQLLSPDVAEKFLCVPLGRVGPERNILLATTGVLSARALAIVADELVVETSKVIASVAPELRIRYHLERAYGIPRDTRFLRSRGKSIPPFPSFQAAPVPVESEPDVVLPMHDFDPEPDAIPQLVDEGVEPIEELEAVDELEELEELDESATVANAAGFDDFEIDMDIPDLEPAIPEPIDPDPSTPIPTTVTETVGRERRRYVPTLADAPGSVAVDERALGRVSLRRVAVTTPPQSGVVQAPIACATLGEATRAIRRANGRDRVAELVLDTLERFAPTCEAALFLILRNEAAIGWRGFARSGAKIPQVAVPIDQTGIVPNVVRHTATARCNADALNPLDQKLLAALGPCIGDLVVVPITIAGQVMCMIAAATAANASVTVVESIAAAAGAAFARLMRDASR